MVGVEASVPVPDEPTETGPGALAGTEGEMTHSLLEIPFDKA